jgi:dephospho-CoA kinase
MRAIIVTGMPGAGKEELLQVAGSMGLPFVRMGDMVREDYAASGKASEMSLGEFASSQRAEFGKDVWARRSMERMSGEVFLVDGCRSMDEVSSFRSLADTAIVAVHAPPSLRYARLVARGREDAPRSESEFLERDRREVGWGIAEVIALADVMLVNDSTLEEFRDAARRALGALI